jgi:hypothetical protein
MKHYRQAETLRPISLTSDITGQCAPSWPTAEVDFAKNNGGVR